MADLFGDATALAGDVVYTPDWCAADMVRHFRPSGRILEPCKGGGAFLRHLPPDAFWCEVAEGRDFFDWSEPVDWIITNPPYSATRPFFCHAKSLAANIVFLVPVRNIFAGYGFVREVVGWGGMAAIRWYGRGSSLGFPMGNAVGAVYWKRGFFDGSIRETFYENEAVALSMSAPVSHPREKAVMDQTISADRTAPPHPPARCGGNTTTPKGG